jgi:hypothetical protein
MTRDAKITRLPTFIREQLNRRLQNSETGREITGWLNALPEVMELLAAEFGGVPISEANLVSWKLGGYRIWEGRQETLEAVAQFGADAAELTEAAGGNLADQVALCLTARIAVALRQPAAGEIDAAGQLRRLRQLCSDLVALRRGDQNAQRLRIEREKLDRQMKTFETEEAARQKQSAKANIDLKTYHASKETHDLINEALRRL